MFEIEIPHRTMVLMGPQRCGKTTAMLAYFKQVVNDGRRVLLIGDPFEVDTFISMAEIKFSKNKHLSLLAIKDDQEPARSPGRYDTVFLIGSYVFYEPGLIGSYHEPAGKVRDFLKRLRDEAFCGIIPYVVCEAHFEGTERNVGELEMDRPQFPVNP